MNDISDTSQPLELYDLRASGARFLDIVLAVKEVLGRLESQWGLLLLPIFVAGATAARLWKASPETPGRVADGLQVTPHTTLSLDPSTGRTDHADHARISDDAELVSFLCHLAFLAQGAKL